MINDNTTPVAAAEYDRQINNTIPFYSEFYYQTFDVIKQYNYIQMDWLDLGCGTGTLESLAFDSFSDINFVLADPSEKMLEKAKEKLKNHSIQYICTDSASVDYSECFNIVTAIQAHHYMHKNERKKATENVYRCLKDGGIYITFENVIPEDEDVKSDELLRWGRYQQRHGKTEDEAKAHNARCGLNYFPLTVAGYIQLLKDTEFRKVHVFWYSFMQMGIYGVK